MSALGSLPKLKESHSGRRCESYKCAFLIGQQLAGLWHSTPPLPPTIFFFFLMYTVSPGRFINCVFLQLLNDSEQFGANVLDMMSLKRMGLLSREMDWALI